MQTDIYVVSDIFFLPGRAGSRICHWVSRTSGRLVSYVIRCGGADRRLAFSAGKFSILIKLTCHPKVKMMLYCITSTVHNFPIPTIIYSFVKR